MKRATAILLLSSSALSESVDDRFNSWTIKYNKQYTTTEERSNANQIFSNNDKLIFKKNNQHLSYKLGHNQFSDLTADEFYNQYVGFKDKDSYLQHRGHHVRELAENVVLPPSVDWTEKNAVTPVKNQGQCGSCW